MFCPEGHVSNVPYFVDADEIQREWTLQVWSDSNCRRNCSGATQRGEAGPDPLGHVDGADVPGRTFEELLEERLALLRASREEEELPRSA